MACASYLYAAAIALSAALLFMVEPAAAKALLPKFGGAAGVWIACILFFQATLLTGYLYAYGLTRFLPERGLKPRFISRCSRPACCLLRWIPPGVGAASGDHPLWAILFTLAASIGLPFFAFSATSPLLQSWYGGVTPYRLFALSNAASLAALLAYPIAIVEPRWPLSAQFQAWAVALSGLRRACAAARYLIAAVPLAKPASSGARPAVLWIALAACAAIALARGGESSQPGSRGDPVPMGLAARASIC